MSNLIIVESPTKASTIKGYLGQGYKVLASKGHVRDLPKSTLGVDIENEFSPKYINIRGKGDLIKELKKEAKAANMVFLATDPDREGEAISWHLAGVLGEENASKIRRVTFNEITKKAVREAIKNPGNINMDLVNSQQARRILDRIVGYKLSALLWKKVKNGLSAGRVQSVATRIIVEREKEIRNFESEEYWTLDASLFSSEKKKFTVRFYGRENKKISLKDKTQTDELTAKLLDADYKVKALKKGERVRVPAPPFTTSQLQQEANKKLNFRSQKTMKIAQELYEGISLGKKGEHGLITYMRTDSVRISDEAAAAAQQLICEKYGENFYPPQRRIFKSKGKVQDAHEAIRPSDVTLEPAMIKSHLTSDQYKLYKLIWSRFVASQMANAIYDTVAVDIAANDEYIFKATGNTVKFQGFMALYEETADDESKEGDNVKLPPLSEGELLALDELLPKQNFTQPPARYTEATLIKALEEKGIGRPSTYTPTITTILSRGYIEHEGKQLRSTPLGEATTEIMCDNFAPIVDYKFTAGMEEQFDEIAEGEIDYVKVLDDFYGDFSKLLGDAEKSLEKLDDDFLKEELDILCEKCGAKMVVKKGRFGRFAACPNYPKCKNAKPLDRDGNIVEKEPDKLVEGMKCEVCGAGVVLRHGKFGDFYSCEKYPECKYTKQIANKIGVVCPKCGGDIVVKRGKKRIFYGCTNYPECDFSTWYLPTGKLCERCGSPMVIKKQGEEPVCSGKNCKKVGK